MTAPSPGEIWRRLHGTDPPGWVGKYKGPLTVLGGGRCLWADMDAAGARNPKHGPLRTGDVMAINDAGMHYHGLVHHWTTFHPEYMAGWMKFRMGHFYGENRRPYTHSIRQDAEIDYVWPNAIVGGTGGLGACLIGLMLGYDRILLCGVPMDGTGHFFDPPWVEDHVFLQEHVQWAWRDYDRDYFFGRVKSMSGNTRAWLGGPETWEPARAA